MGRTDGRIEPGQPLAGAISARAWNRAQDAADIVLGATPGIAAGPPNPQDSAGRVIVTMRKRKQSEEIFPGNAVMFAIDLDGEGEDQLTMPMFPVGEWPATKNTFENSVFANSSSDRVRSIMYSHLTKRLPPFHCELLTPESVFAAQDFFPDVGIAVSASDSDTSSVRVCISGPCVAYVRFLFDYQINQRNLCAIRPRIVGGITGPLSDPKGCLDAHRGGNIRILGSRWSTGLGTMEFPNIFLMPVML